jgi:hypothetical protein
MTLASAAGRRAAQQRPLAEDELAARDRPRRADRAPHLGRAAAVSHCTIAHPLHTRFTKMLGASIISEIAVRPNPSAHHRVVQRLEEPGPWGAHPRRGQHGQFWDPHGRSEHRRNVAGPRLPRQPSEAAGYYRGFIRKADRVHIITFRDTTRMQSKSNRCI